LWSKDSQASGAVSDEPLKQKRAFERDLQDRIIGMLERVLGPNKATTQVNVELDLREVVTSEDIYDPDGSVVRSEQRIQERETGPGRANAGIPNATYELGTANRQNSGAEGNQVVSSRTEETTNYEISNTKRKTIAASGDLKKVTVAVLVDGVFTEGENGERVFTPLPPEMMNKLAEAIKNTIGFDEKRGDSVSVSCLEFYREEQVSVWAVFLLDLLREFGRPLLNLLLIILFFIFVIRPILNWLKKEVEPVGSGSVEAVLPDYPGGGGMGESLALPLPPREEATATETETSQAAAASAEVAEAADDLAPGDEDAPRYDDEEPEEVEPDSGRLEYGKLSRDNILPLARENMERTVGLLRRWIEQKNPESQPEK
ncbi:MAG: hypothetical protein LBR53_03370, partial [Deltaproteobacteria bacterium]|nr:hypothetical protein [Deltaproteobacteria bacterium]